MTEKSPQPLSEFAILLKRWADGEDITAGKTYAPEPPKKKKRRPPRQTPVKRKPPTEREGLVIFDEEAYAASRETRDD